MIRVSHREVEPDHVVRQRHARVEGCRTCVVAVMHAHPCDAAMFRFRNGGLRRGFHHEMAHAVVAVDESHAVALALDADVWMEIDAAGANSTHVLRQSEYAVPLGPTQIRAHHQLSDGARIGKRHADRFQDARDERPQRSGIEPALGDVPHRYLHPSRLMNGYAFIAVRSTTACLPQRSRKRRAEMQPRTMAANRSATRDWRTSARAKRT